MVFWQYYTDGKEVWLTPDQFNERQAKHRDNSKRCRLGLSSKRKLLPQAERAEANRLRMAAWRHSEHGKAWMRKYEAGIAEKRRAQQRKWRLENYEHALRKRAKYRVENAARMREWGRQWRSENRDSVRAYNASRRAIRRAAKAGDACSKAIGVIFQWARRLETCLGIKYEVDHVMPLSRGGEHSARNLQPLPAVFNRRKYNRPDYPLPDCYRTDGYLIQGKTISDEKHR